MRVSAAAIGFSLLCAACATAPAREPVRPDPGFIPLTEACSELGIAEPVVAEVPKPDPQPYGWSIVKIDVEQGAVVKVEVIDSSPAKRFDAETVAVFKRMHFPSMGSAHGCVWSHKWG